MSCVLMDNRDGRDQYDNDGFIVQDISRERRDAGERGPIIGNWKHLEVKTKAHSSNQPQESQPEEDDDIPF